jgi:Tfp pilus assembly protein PilO
VESGELIKRNNKLLIVLLLIERLVLVVGWVLYISFDKEVGVW